ncbi:MAG TPA: CotH kinase family protein [Polyangiaceae bacterium]|nr:CotH kinase family protein [Polyangiaceae bacterium]
MSRTQSLASCPWSRIAVIALFALGNAACSDSEPAPSRAPEVDQSEALYAPDRLVEIAIEMDEAEWDALRDEGHSLLEFQQGTPVGFDYTYFSASVKVDDKPLERVAIRKKGALGSLSRFRPSLILDIDRNVEDQKVYGVNRLTLNNDRSDSAHARTCMAYELFTKAGLPASRCNLAHVTVNGHDLGTYSNVEPIRKPMLARHFADNDGNLYEGQEDADFTQEAYQRFQVKTNEDKNDKSDLARVAQAMEADDAHLVTELSKVIDLDHFRRFWAMETLSGNWDSYSGNTNNFFTYHDPTTDKFYFMPWGPDASFTGASIIDSYNKTLTVYATGAISNRLYNIPSERKKFRDLLADLNDGVWDTPALLSRLYELQDISTDAWPGAVENLREYISTYSDRLRAELAEPAPEWKLGGIDLRDECAGQLGEASASFQFPFTSGELSPDPSVGAVQATLKIGDKSIEAFWFGGVGRNPEGSDRQVGMQLFGAMPDGRIAILALSMPPQGFAPGTQPFYNFETVGYVVIGQGEEFKFAGLVTEGSIEFDEASMEAGADVAGSFHGLVYQTGCVDL